MTAIKSQAVETEASSLRSHGDSPSSDVLIIGGGILGLSTACEILARGLSVTLFDEDPRRSATWASAGMLAPYAEHEDLGSLQDMMRAARASYPAYVAKVEQYSGMRIELSFPGTILPSLSSGDEARLEELAVRFREMGARCRYLDPQAVAQEEPQLGPKASGALLIDEEGFVNPRSLHTALRSAFHYLGGRWVPLHVLGLIARQMRVAGIETSAGIVLGGAVVNAAGAWADRFLLPEDQGRFRLKPIRGQTVRLRPPSRHHGIRHVIQLPSVGYLVPRADGSVTAGATSEDVGPFLGTTAGGIASVLDGARRLVPEVENWSFVGAWSGLRPMAGSGELHLEPDSTRRGLFHGLGLYRHGILLAPVAATRLCRMVVEYLGRQGQ